jgi:hypothetical protein
LAADTVWSGAVDNERSWSDDTTLLKALTALMLVGESFTGSAVSFHRERKASPFLQLMGTSCLLVVVLTHIGEALRLFPYMGGGREHSVGHYFDQTSAAIGMTLFPLGYLHQTLE